MCSSVSYIYLLARRFYLAWLQRAYIGAFADYVDERIQQFIIELVLYLGRLFLHISRADLSLWLNLFSQDRYV